jgi:predicted Zn-dependent protease
MTDEEKIERLQALVAADPSDSLGQFMLGKLLLDTGRLEEATAAFARCVELKEEYSAAWRFLGDCYRKREMPAEARQTYERGHAVATRLGDLQAAREMEAFLRKLEL